MSLFKRLFGGGGNRGSREETTPHLASELQACIRDAERLVAGGRLEEALRIAKRGLHTFPTAERLRNVVRFIQCEGALQKITALKDTLEESRDEGAYRELVALYLDLSKVDSALETAQAYVVDHPETSESHTHLARVQVTRYFEERFARDGWAVIEALEKALELDPDSLDAHRYGAVFYFALGAMQHCADCLDHVLRVDPEQAESLAEFRDEVAARVEQDEDVEWLLDEIEEGHELPNDPGLFPGANEFALDARGGVIDPELFAEAATTIGQRLKLQQLAAVSTDGRELAVSGEDPERYVPFACRLDSASRRAGRRMSFGTMKRFMVEGKFGRIVLVPAGNCAVAARVPRSISSDRVADGLEMIVTASRSASAKEEEE